MSKSALQWHLSPSGMKTLIFIDRREQSHVKYPPNQYLNMVFGKGAAVYIQISDKSKWVSFLSTYIICIINVNGIICTHKSRFNRQNIQCNETFLPRMQSPLNWNLWNRKTSNNAFCWCGYTFACMKNLFLSVFKWLFCLELSYSGLFFWPILKICRDIM